MDLIYFFISYKYSYNLVNVSAHSFIKDNRIRGRVVNVGSNSFGNK